MFNLEPLGKILIITGCLFVAAGVVITFWHRIPLLGKMPGDIFLQKDGPKFFFPVISCLVFSIVLTMVINLVLYWFVK
jgi:hypothetical protein